MLDTGWSSSANALIDFPRVMTVSRSMLECELQLSPDSRADVYALRSKTYLQAELKMRPKSD
jgi:hypothetical protein